LLLLPKRKEPSTRGICEEEEDVLIRRLHEVAGGECGGSHEVSEELATDEGVAAVLLKRELLIVDFEVREKCSRLAFVGFDSRLMRGVSPLRGLFFWDDFDRRFLLDELVFRSLGFG
jgi:hypothetical protein